VSILQILPKIYFYGTSSGFCGSIVATLPCAAENVGSGSEAIGTSQKHFGTLGRSYKAGQQAANPTAKLNLDRSKE
jgi:hypothetical protein